MSLNNRFIHINELNLSIRSRNALMRSGIDNVYQLAGLRLEDILQIRNVGETSANEILIKVASFVESNQQRTENLVYANDEIYKAIINSQPLKIFNDFPLQLLELPLDLLYEIDSLGVKTLYDLYAFFQQGLEYDQSKIKERLITELNRYENVERANSLLDVNEEELNSLRNKVVLQLLEFFNNLDLSQLLNYLDQFLIAHISENKNWESKDFFYSDHGLKLFKSSFISDLLALKEIEIIENHPLGIDDEKIFDNHPDWIPRQAIRKALLVNEEKRLVAKDKHGLRFIKRLTLNEFIKTLPEARHQRILLSRYRGRRLEEIGKEEGVTRERIRQIEAQVKAKIPMIEEDRYKGVFSKYKFGQEDFCEIFGVGSEVFGYLKGAIKTNKGLSLDQLLIDPDFPNPYKNNVRKIINRNAIIIENKIIRKKKSEILDCLVKLNLNHSFTHEEFFDIYNAFLEDNNLHEEETLLLNLRTLDGLLSRNKNVVSTLGKQFKVIDFEGTDFTELLDTIGLDEYEDVELSTLVFFDNYPELMKKYHLTDHYLLHNLLKNLYSDSQDTKVKFGRMPMIQIGNADTYVQIMDLIRQYSPVSKNELAKLYRSEYGVEEPTFIGYYLKDFDKFYHDGVFNVEIKQFENKHKIFLKQHMTADFHFIEEIKDKFEQEFDEDFNDYLTKGLLNLIGYSIIGKLFLSNRFHTFADYILKEMSENGVLAENKINPNILKTSTYRNSIYNLLRDGVVVEFLPNQYITMEKLEENGIGREEIDRFCQKVYDWDTKGVYFTIKSLENTGFSSRFDDYGFDPYFYNSLLSYDPSKRFSAFRLFNTKVICKETENANASDFLTEVISLKGNLEINDFCQHLNEFYGMHVDRTKLLQVIKGSDLYYDDIYETVFFNYDAYIEGDII